MFDLSNLIAGETIMLPKTLKLRNPRSCGHFNRVITAHVWRDQEVLSHCITSNQATSPQDYVMIHARHWQPA
jgi:hypothetical protein